jgi:lipopolysaccharide transport system permease protein
MPPKRYLDILIFKTYADLKAEAAKTYLSFLWWVLEPVLYMLVFYIVFGVIFQRGDGPEYIPFLLCGVTVWKWFESTLRTGAVAIQSNANLMSQVFIPKIIFPSITILTNTVKFLFVLVVFLLFLEYYGLGINLTYLSLPILLIIQLLLISACTFLLAALVPFMPDIVMFVSYALTLLLFLSGIFFSVEQIPETYQKYFYINPMATIIESYRDVLLYTRWPNWRALGFITLLSGLGVWFSWWIIAKFERVYPKIV